MMSSLSFCLSEKVLIYPIFLKNNFDGYRILLWWTVSSFITEYFIPYSAGLHDFWPEDHCNSYTCFYIFKVFFPCSVLPPQKGFLFEFGFLLSEYDMPMWGLFWVFFPFLSGIYLAWCSLSLLGLWFAVIHFGKFLAIFISNISSLHSSCVCVPFIYILHFLKLSHSSWMFQSLFVFFWFFFLCISFWQVSIDISWNPLILPLSNDESIKFIISVTVFFF